MYSTIEEVKQESGLLSLKTVTNFYWGERTGIRSEMALEPEDQHTENILENRLNNLRTISPKARDILVQMGFHVVITLKD